ncbi:ABC transporter substrate-binding protein [Bradyrhizobium sp. 35]|uniref:ABC transporter substrate-binding protein n=1 Tax=Bradyrhizobium sp. 35 TaxID=2782670 RepID=UPI001FF85BC8|nr:ABC transporter substrate-binding protein [Bradyrhizobium sp. 35]MCK1450501.1 ABC transporter substrate-binding protein [Bradyrhizobium sp. 35]
MSRQPRLLDDLRSNLTSLENHLVDGHIDGRVSRRDFLRHGSVLGLSLPFLAQVTMVAGYSAAPSVARAAAQPGATIRIACASPKQAIDPVRGGTPGCFLLTQQVGEFLCVPGPDLILKPSLATSWKPNQDGSAWTFSLRKGVKFHSGGEMKADDVVATMDRLINPENTSNALTVFRGVLSQGAIRKVDDYTVEFHLDGPNGNFPYLVSSDNYNAIILPASYSGNFEDTWDGTGPFKIDRFTRNVGVSFVRNDDYWGPKALPAKTEFLFFEDIQPQILALQAGQVDMINKIPALAGIALLSNPAVEIINIKSSANQLVAMKCDAGPFKDPRVRRAVALCLDREKLVKGLMKGYAAVGNDTPFASIYPSADPTVPQRRQDIAQAKELMKAAGMEKGFQVTLSTSRYLEIPEYAQLIQGWVKQIGIDLKLDIMDYMSFYGQFVPGQSPFFDAVLGIDDYVHRGVPNFHLSALLKSDGVWNTARFNNKEYDALAKSYVASLDLEAQRAVSGKIQRLVLEETPYLWSYFYDQLTATKKGLVGVQPTAVGHLFLQNAGMA